MTENELLDQHHLDAALHDYLHCLRDLGNALLVRARDYLIWLGVDVERLIIKAVVVPRAGRRGRGVSVDLYGC